MTKPRRVLLYHLTHVDNLPSIANDGLRSDGDVEDNDLLEVDIGNQDVKARRRRMAVPVGPGGVVADYVPFYFAPRSPMLFAIHRGGVPTFSGGQGGLVYLVARVDTIVDRGLGFALTDRNAASALARFSDRIDDLEELVDWPLMAARMWNDTLEDPDRMSRRMAEFLVHERVPWDTFIALVARTDEEAENAAARLGNLRGEIQIVVRPRWYY
ncbi:MAG: DUF4433 domain-containing protein [bacterium]|nr:DUF4433 domain-containing protein [bacterium]MDE0667719.1 DUF4433 domain-containing protein [bacterium]MYB24500.1 DUF4433 domain-containing protein [Acidimicrobiia bacterium]